MKAKLKRPKGRDKNQIDEERGNVGLLRSCRHRVSSAVLPTVCCMYMWLVKRLLSSQITESLSYIEPRADQDVQNSPAVVVVVDVVDGSAPSLVIMTCDVDSSTI